MSKRTGTGLATGTTMGTMAGAETTTGRVPPWQPAKMKPVARIAGHFNRIRESFLVTPDQEPSEKRIAIFFFYGYIRWDDPQLTQIRRKLYRRKKRKTAILLEDGRPSMIYRIPSPRPADDVM